MGAESPPKTRSAYSRRHRRRRRLPFVPRPPSVSISSSSAFFSFSFLLSHGSDIEAVARSAAPPLPPVSAETGASR